MTSAGVPALLAVSNVTIGIGVVSLFTFILVLWGFVSVVRRPGWAFAAAGKSKVLWTVLLLVGFFLPGLGIVVAVIALLSVVPDVDRQVQVGPGIGFPGGAR